MRTFQTQIPVWFRLKVFRDFSQAAKEGKAWTRDMAFILFVP
jgi:hypothetical protein